MCEPSYAIPEDNTADRQSFFNSLTIARLNTMNVSEAHSKMERLAGKTVQNTQVIRFSKPCLSLPQKQAVLYLNEPLVIQ